MNLAHPGITPTWRIIPVSKWLITMVDKSSKDRVVSPSKWPKWLINRVTNHLLSGMILQAGQVHDLLVGKKVTLTLNPTYGGIKNRRKLGINGS